MHPSQELGASCAQARSAVGALTARSDRQTQHHASTIHHLINFTLARVANVPVVPRCLTKDIRVTGPVPARVVGLGPGPDITPWPCERICGQSWWP